MTMGICNKDCFNCPFPDCVNDEGADAAEYAEAREREITIRDAQRDGKGRKLAARNRAYYEANREKIAARNRAYREANREEINAYMREYRRKRRQAGSGPAGEPAAARRGNSSTPLGGRTISAPTAPTAGRIWH